MNIYFTSTRAHASAFPECCRINGIQLEISCEHAAEDSSKTTTALPGINTRGPKASSDSCSLVRLVVADSEAVLGVARGGVVGVDHGVACAH